MSVFWFAISLVLLVAAFASLQRTLNGPRRLVSVQGVVAITFTLYLIFPALLTLLSGRYTWAPAYYSEETFGFTLVIGNVALASFLFGTLVARAGRRQRPEPVFPRSAIEPDRALGGNPLVWLLLAVGLGLKAWLLISTGGLESSVVRLSTYASDALQLEELDSESILLRAISGVADAAATWGLMRAIRTRRSVFWWAVIFAAILTLSYATIGKRLLLLLPILCIVVALDRYRGPVRVALFPVLFAVAIGLGLLTLFARIFIPAALAGISIDLNVIDYAGGSLANFYFYSLEFSTVEMMTVSIYSASAIAGLFGGAPDAFLRTNIEPLLYLVPGSVWPGKPEVFYDMSYGVSAILGATPFERPTVGYASTLVGTSYVVSGVVGLVVIFTIFGILGGRFDQRQELSPPRLWGTVLIAITLVFSFHFMRQGTFAWAVIVTFVQQIGFFLGMALIAVASRKTPSLPIAERPAQKDGVSV